MTVQDTALRPFKMNILVLEGSARERGRIHGESLRTQIRELFEWHKDSLRDWFDVNVDEYLAELVEGSGLYRAVREYTPDLLEEVLGIAEGAAMDTRSALAWQLLDEGWWFPEHLRQRPQGAGAAYRCSALGAMGQAGHPTLLAQNSDCFTRFDGEQTLLHIKPEGSSLETFVFTYPGVVGVYGLNSRGVGVCLNAMGSYMNYSPNGLGTFFVSRGILAHETLQSAVEFVRTVRHATGENYTIGGPDGVVAYECSANQVRRFVPASGATRAYHTNHPLVNDDVRLSASRIESLPVEKRIGVDRDRLDSETRFSALKNRLRETAEPVTIDTIKGILGSHDSPDYPVCRHKPVGPGVMTIACLIMALSENPELHISSGPACQTEFRTFKF
jgi:isopenicillin-N N-acyltransferase like protein